jgi:hypothetical protein
MTIAAPRSDLEDSVEFRALFEEARQRRRRRRRMAGAAVALVVALIAGLCVLVASGSARRGPTTSLLGPHRVGTFAHPTGVVLVFADGLSLDLDRRTALVRTIAGQRAGDQRWDIVRAGDSVVVGWGQVWANAIAGGAPRLLGPVVTFVPAAEARAVWLVNYPGARIGEGTPTLSEVTTTGRVIQSELGPPALSGVPIVGIPGGLAFESRTGIAFWNAEQRAFVRYLGSRAGFIGNAAHGQVAWCEGLCTSLHVTAVVGSDKEFPSPQSRQAFEPDSVRLSPDGRYVAAITTREGLGTANQLGSLNVIDTRTGHVDVVRDRVSVWSTMTWTADSRTVFFASDNSSGMTVGKFRVGTRNADTAEIPIRNAEQFVIVNRSAAKVILSRVAHEPASACSPMVASSDSSPGCAFGY